MRSDYDPSFPEAVGMADTNEVDPYALTDEAIQIRQKAC